jgi:hypothetical protein
MLTGCIQLDSNVWQRHLVVSHQLLKKGFVNQMSMCQLLEKDCSLRLASVAVLQLPVRWKADEWRVGDGLERNARGLCQVTQPCHWPGITEERNGRCSYMAGGPYL